MSGKYSSEKDEHPETFVVFWLDAEVTTSEHNKAAHNQLRSICKHLQIFNDQGQCRERIEAWDGKDRLILIVSGRIGRELVPEIHPLRQLSSIYVYCQDKSLHEEWARHYFKVREVIVDLDRLIAEIQFAQRSRRRTELPISFNIYTMTDDPETSFVILNKNFIQSFTLINLLLRLESNVSDDQHEFLSFCKKECKGRKNQSNIIDEFRENYQAEKVLWWYTRDLFFYRKFDQILRSTTEHFEQFLLSRSLMMDMYDQLKQHQYPSSIRVYSGQLMWYAEIEYLRNSKSRYFMNNTFWLTNTKREKVIELLTNLERENCEHQVLFTIDAEPDLGKSKSFADISKLCHFDEDGEILFMIGSVFRIIDVTEDQGICVVRLELCDDQKQFTESMEIIDGNERISLRTLGNLLHRMELYDLAERMYRQLLAKLPSNDPAYSDLYFALATASKAKKDYDSSLESYKKALKRADSSDYLIIGKLHACMGEIHRLKDNDKEALKCFVKAIEIFTKSHAEYHHHMADFYDNAALICKRLKRNQDALDYYKKALIVDEKRSASNSLSAAKTHNSIGIIYCLLEQYDLALAHYQYSLNIKLNTHPSPRLSIAKSYVNIASVYRSMNDLDKALENYRKVVDIYQDLLPNQDPDFIQIKNEIQVIAQRRN